MESRKKGSAVLLNLWGQYMEYSSSSVAHLPVINYIFNNCKTGSKGSYTFFNT